MDPKVLASLRELGDAGLVCELAGMFVRDATDRLAALQRAVGSGDAATVDRTAHTLKGSAANMGATALAKISADLQDAGERGDLERAGALLEALEEEFERVRPELEFVAGGGAP